MKKYLTKNKVYLYKGVTVSEIFCVEISGLDDAWEKMFEAFEFADYSPFTGAEDMALEKAFSSRSQADVLRIASQNAKADVSVTRFYATKIEDKALLSEFVKNIEFVPTSKGYLGEATFAPEAESEKAVKLAVTCGMAGKGSAAAILNVRSDGREASFAKAEAISEKVSAPVLALARSADFSAEVFVDSSHFPTGIAEQFTSNDFKRDFAPSDMFRHILDSDVRKAAVVALSDKAVGSADELQKSFTSLEKGYSAFCGKGQTVLNRTVKFDVSGRRFLLSANNLYDAEYNAFVALEDAVFEGATLDFETTLFASSALKPLAETLGIRFSETSVEAGVVVSKTGAEKSQSFPRAAKLFLLHIPRDEKKAPDINAFSNVLKLLYDALSDGSVYAARSVGAGGAAVAAIVGAMAEGKGVYFKNCATELFAPFVGDVVVAAAKKPCENAIEIGEVIDNPQAIFGDDVVSMEIAKVAYGLYWKKFYPSADFSARVLRTEGFGFSNRSAYFGKSTKAKVAVPYFTGPSEVLDLCDGFSAAKAKVESFGMSAADRSELTASLKAFEKQVAASQILCFSSEKAAAILLNERARDAVYRMLEAGGLILGVGGGFSALVKSGLLPFEKLTLPQRNPIKILPSKSGRKNMAVKVKVSGNLSPWFNLEAVGDQFTAALYSDAVCADMTEEDYASMVADGLIATQFVDDNGMAASEYPHNPTGSFNAIEGLTSPDGRILGRICHAPKNLALPGENFETKLYEAGVKYFK